jgi:hypothetical protein
MRLWRECVLMCCGLVVLAGVFSLAASPEPRWICCNDPSDCGGRLCCPPELVGMPNCSDDELPGFCMSVCIKPEG